MANYQHSGRTDQSKAGKKRLVDAKMLFQQRRWRGAMYLAGYCVECSLKTRLMEKYNLETIHQLEEEIERRTGRSVNLFTHSIEVLFDLTEAKDRLLTGPDSRVTIRAYHQCNSWSPSWRYNPDDGCEENCNDFLEAVTIFGKFIDHTNPANIILASRWLYIYL